MESRNARVPYVHNTPYWQRSYFIFGVLIPQDIFVLDETHDLILAARANTNNNRQTVNWITILYCFRPLAGSVRTVASCSNWWLNHAENGLTAHPSNTQRQSCHHFPDDISHLCKWKYLNSRFKFHSNLFLWVNNIKVLVQIMAWHGTNDRLFYGRIYVYLDLNKVAEYSLNNGMRCVCFYDFCVIR